jgi:hypothetical protein
LRALSTLKEVATKSGNSIALQTSPRRRGTCKSGANRYLRAKYPPNSGAYNKAPANFAAKRPENTVKIPIFFDALFNLKRRDETFS